MRCRAAQPPRSPEARCATRSTLPCPRCDDPLPELRDRTAPGRDPRTAQVRRQGQVPAAGAAPSRAPMVERIACWSARHRIAVVVGWLVLAGTALAAGQLLGTQSQQQYDPGQAGQAEQMLHQLNVVSPAQETVLIQARGSSAREHLRATTRSCAARSPTWSRRCSDCPRRPGTSGPRSARAARPWSRPTAAPRWSRSRWPARTPARTPRSARTWPRWPGCRPLIRA